MKTHSRLVAQLAIVCALAFISQGCKDGPVAAAEKTVTLSYKAVDTFIQFDDQNRAVLAEKAPAVHATAEKIRTEAPKTFLAAWDSIQTYKTLRDEINKNKMDSSVGKAAKLGSEATLGMADGSKALGGS